MPVNPYEAYQKRSVMTMTPGEMLSKLYDKVLQELTLSKMDLEKKDFHLYAEVDRALRKAQVILNYLKSTLDFKYDVANNLNMLYDYFLEQIVKANIQKDPAPLAEIIPMITDLQETYTKADKLSRESRPRSSGQG